MVPSTLGGLVEHCGCFKEDTATYTRRVFMDCEPSSSRCTVHS